MLVRLIPFVAKESCFALKGGTAINLFVRDLPRLSVDIDLAYLPLHPRAKALKDARYALVRIMNAINKQQGLTARMQSEQPDSLRLLINEDWVFRPHPATDSVNIRPPIPLVSGH